jgi:uncharacterized membrane-anchored protein
VSGLFARCSRRGRFDPAKREAAGSGNNMADLLIYSVIVGIAAFIVACIFALMSGKNFEEALITSMFVLGAVIILPMIVDVFLPTNLSAMLPGQKIPTLIGVLFVMPGISFLLGRLRSWRR